MNQPNSAQTQAIEQKRLNLQRILYPLLLGLVIIGAWQGMVTLGDPKHPRARFRCPRRVQRVTGACEYS